MLCAVVWSSPTSKGSGSQIAGWSDHLTRKHRAGLFYAKTPTPFHAAYCGTVKDDSLPNISPLAGLISLQRWRQQAGISDTTAWRYRRRGWLRCVNICGKLYLRSEDLAEFTNRAAAGEFAKPATGAARESSAKRAAKEATP